MGGAGLVLIWAVGTSSVATSSVAQSSTAAVDVGDVPLSPEDLALLAALSTATASEAAPPPPPIWAAPSFDGGSTRSVARARLLETGGRSIRESLDSLPTLGWAPRVAFETMVYDGVELDPVGFGAALDIHPLFFGGLVLHRSGNLAHVGREGLVELEGREPEAALSAEAVALLRSADRSSGLYGTVTGGLGPIATRLSLSYADFSSLRVPTTRISEDLGAPYQRWNFAGRAAYRGHFYRLVVGADVDRVLNQPLVDFFGEVRGRTEVGQRHLVFLSGVVEGSAGQVGLTLSGQGERVEATVQSSTRIEHDDVWQARAWGRWSLLEWLALKGGGLLSMARLGSDGVRRDLRTEAWAGVEARGRALLAQGSIRVAHYDPMESATQAADRVFVDLGAEWTIVGPLAVGSAIRSGAGSLDELAIVRTDARPRFEIGPRLRFVDAWLELTAFYAQYALPNLNDGGAGASVFFDAFGLELEGAWSLSPTWTIAVAANYAELRSQRDGESQGPVPSAQGLLSLRHDFRLYGAYCQVHARAGTAGLYAFSIDHRNDDDNAFLRLGLSGGLTLGWGLTFQLAIENALDQEVRFPNALTQEAGIDLRTSLEWAY